MGGVWGGLAEKVCGAHGLEVVAENMICNSRVDF